MLGTHWAEAGRDHEASPISRRRSVALRAALEFSHYFDSAPTSARSHLKLQVPGRAPELRRLALSQSPFIVCDMAQWHYSLLAFPALILLHLYVSPDTKVEESFNIQAVHDILEYGIPFQNVGSYLHEHYDHMTFPGAVPRTFVGALALAGFSRPLVQYWLRNGFYHQMCARALLGMFNAWSLVAYANGVFHTYGSRAGYWYIALQASQFHVLYYASRTLPNMFAFGISTFALALLLPTAASAEVRLKRVSAGLTLLTVATAVFRSELALLLASQSMYLLLQASNNQARGGLLRRAIIPSVLTGAIVGLLISVPIDTFFWSSSNALWPELVAFVANVFPSSDSPGASAWGTSPWYWYFTSALPRLVLNPLVLIHLPASLAIGTTRARTLPLLTPSLLYTALYSLLPHKETRFLFPIIPPFTASAAVTAAYLSNRITRHTLYRLSTYIVLATTALTFLTAHTILLPLSSLSYPGAAALARFHQHSPPNTSIHIDNLALQTGVTRFLQLPDHVYDKSENPKELLSPAFWASFDYAIMENPHLAIGAWEILDVTNGLGKPLLLGPEVMEMPREGEMESVRPGTAEVVQAVYGRSAARACMWVEDEVRGGVGLEGLCERVGVGRQRCGLTGGWWVSVEMVPRLYLLKRVDGVGSTEPNAVE